MTDTTSRRGSAGVRAGLEHPVVDADGHIQEYLPAALPYLRDALGADLFRRYIEQPSPLALIMGDGATDSHRTQIPQSSWWGTPARNTRDLATAVIPRLLHDRLDEFGIDYAVLYPSKALGVAGVADAELRTGLCRGFNNFFAGVYGPYADRMTVGGVIPMHHPAEAVAELRHCHELGLKVVGFPEGVTRPIAEPGHPSPWLMPGQTHWFDTFAIDSEYDYDEVWAETERLGFAATFHGGIGNIMPFQFTSTSNYVYNHIGFFGQRMQRLCKSLFFGGVTNRFPRLNIAFLECGVGWASSLLVDIIEHWEKRNLDALEHNLDPALIDYELFEQLMRTHGSDLLGPESGDLRARLHDIPAVGVEPADRDEFSAARIDHKRDIYDRFVPRFFFGCEADDRTVAFAFSSANPFGAKLQPIFSSDISHWDVEDMAGVVDEAFGLVRNGVLTEDNFADFVFRNPVRMFTDAAPNFFAGTPVESYAAKLAQS